MDHTDEKVIALWTNGTLPQKVHGDGDLWPTALETVIFPTYRLCQERLAGMDRHSDICQPANFTKPFVVLFWQGKEALENHRIGLQFTYGGQGKFAFDLSVLRFDDDNKHQTSLHQEYFHGCENDFSSKILARCMYGMGMAMSLENPLSMKHATWTNRPYVRPPTRLC